MTECSPIVYIAHLKSYWIEDKIAHLVFSTDFPLDIQGFRIKFCYNFTKNALKPMIKALGCEKEMREIKKMDYDSLRVFYNRSIVIVKEDDKLTAFPLRNFVQLSKIDTKPFDFEYVPYFIEGEVLEPGSYGETEGDE